MAAMISRRAVGHFLGPIREIVGVTQSQEVGWKRGSSCDCVPPTFYRKHVLKRQRLLRKRHRGHPRNVSTMNFRRVDYAQVHPRVLHHDISGNVLRWM